MTNHDKNLTRALAILCTRLGEIDFAVCGIEHATKQLRSMQMVWIDAAGQLLQEEAA